MSLWHREHLLYPQIIRCPPNRVNSNETWEVELPIEASLKGFLEGLMAEERAVYLAAGFRERTPKRRDWANGHYVRDLGTEGG